MNLSVITAPSVEPITTAVAKTHLRVTHDNDNDYIDTLIKAARSFIESYISRYLVQRTCLFTINDFPDSSDDVIKLPVAPVQSVSSIVYTDNDGVETTWSASNYALDTNDYQPSVYLAYNQSWPSDVRDIRNAVKITFIAGYDDDGASPPDYRANIPDDIIHAMKLMIGHWYSNRLAVDTMQNDIPLPFGVKELLAPHKRYGF